MLNLWQKYCIIVKPWHTSVISYSKTLTYEWHKLYYSKILTCKCHKIFFKIIIFIYKSFLYENYPDGYYTNGISTIIIKYFFLIWNIFILIYLFGNKLFYSYYFDYIYIKSCTFYLQIIKENTYSKNRLNIFNYEQDWDKN